MKIDLDPTDEKLIRSIIQRHIPNAEVWAFGSRVKNTATSSSDLDLVVIANKDMSWDTLNSIREDLEFSDLPFNVDVLDWQEISEDFRNAICDHYVIFQKAA